MSAAKKEETILVDFSAGVDPAATDQRILSTQGWPGPTLLALDLGLDCGWCLVLDGRYKESGVVADKDIFADGLDPASGEAITAPLNGLTNLGGADPVGNVGKKLWELLGLTQAQSAAEGAYDLAITANTVGSAAGTVSGFFWYILG